MDVSKLSGLDLVRKYNEVAESKAGKEVGLRTVNSFADDEDGRAKLEKALSSVKARTEGLKNAGKGKAAGKEVKGKGKKDAAPAKGKKAAAPAKGKKTKAAADDGDPKSRTNNADTIEGRFGIRSGGDRAAVLRALHDNLGKPMLATDLAKMIKGDKARVASCCNRIEKKADKYSLPFRVVSEKDDGGERTYKLVSARR